MKTLIVLAMSILAGCMNCLAQTNQDTTIVVNNAKKVTIEKSSHSMSVKVEGTAENPSYFYSQQMEVDSTAAVISKEKNTNWDFTIPFVNKKKKIKKNYYIVRDNTSIGIGMVNAANASDELNIDMGASFELLVDNLLKSNFHLTPSTSISLGLGATCRNYRMTGNTRFVKEGNNLFLDKYPEGAEIKFSRLKTFSITIPLMIHQAITLRAALSVGPVVNINTYGSLKTRYILNDEKIHEKSKNIRQNSATIDYMAQIHLGEIGLYAKYSPSSVLNPEFGPKFSSFSAGICWFIF